MRDTGPIAKAIEQQGDTDAAAACIGVARTTLGHLANLMRLGGLQVGTRSVTLPDGTTIRAVIAGGVKKVYISAPGMSTPLVIPETTIPKSVLPEFEPPEIPQPTDKYLLVIFNSTQWAAIPMASLTTSHWPVARHGKLKVGLSQRVNIAQYNFAVPGCDSIFLAPFSLAPFSVARTPITLDTQYYWLNAIAAGDDSPHAVRAVRTTAEAVDAPVFNANGATVYLADGVYRIEKSTPKLQQSYVAQTAGYGPSTIDSDGNYYYGGKVIRDATPASPISNHVGHYPASVALQGGSSAYPPAWSALIASVIEPSYTDSSGTHAGNTRTLGYGTQIVFNGSTPNVLYKANYVSYSGGASGVNPDGSTYIITEPTPGVNSWASGFKWGNSDPDYNFGINLGVYRNDGTKDFLAPQIVKVGASATITGKWVYNSDGSTGTDATTVVNSTLAVGNWADNLTYTDPFTGPATTSETGFPQVDYQVFPPALSVTKAYITPIDTAFNSQAITPYGTLPGYGAYGWLHLSNGRHFMQAFFVSTDAPQDPAYVFYDGVDVTSRLNHALASIVPGATVLNAQAMVIDLPLSLIEALQ